MKSLSKNFLITFLVFLAIASLFSIYLSPDQETTKLDITSMVNKINQGEVNSIKIIDNKIVLTLADETLVEVQKEPTESLGDLLNNYQVDSEKLKQVKIEVEQDSSLEFWMMALLPFSSSSTFGSSFDSLETTAGFSFKALMLKPKRWLVGSIERILNSNTSPGLAISLESLIGLSESSEI